MGKTYALFLIYSTRKAISAIATCDEESKNHCSSSTCMASQERCNRNEDGTPILHPLGQWDDDWLDDARFKDWLRVSEGQVHCLYCRATDQHNEFNTGRPVSDEWNMYKGTNEDHKGNCTMHFQVFRRSIYIDLENEPYGLGGKWVDIDRV